MSCEIFANNIVPQGSYICLNCKNEVVLNSKDYLLRCPKCGGERYALNSIIEIKPDEFRKKFEEIIEMMIISSYFTEKLEMEGFIAVLAQTLKLLLQNGADSLLPRMYPDFTFRKAPEHFTDSVILPKDLFSGISGELRIDEFLNQIVVNREQAKSLTVGKIIETIVEKQGLSAIKATLTEDEYLCCAAGKFYLTALARYITEKIGIDYDEKVHLFLAQPFNKI